MTLIPPCNVKSLATLAALCGTAMSSACGSEHDAAHAVHSHHHGLASIDHMAAAASAATPSTFLIRQAQVPAPGLCLAAKDGASDDGTRIVLATCKEGSRAQSWQHDGATLRLFGDKCLDVINGRDRDGTHLQIWSCDSENINQQWHTDGGVLQWNEHSRCAGLFEETLSAGDAPQMWRCHFNLPAQQWQLQGATRGKTATPHPPATSVPVASTPSPLGSPPVTSTQAAAVACREIGSWPSASAAFEAEVLTRINARRAQGATCGTNGRFAAQPPLVASSEKLTCVARAYAKDMSNRHYFSHTDPSGRSPFDRMVAAGITYRAAAENIAQGQRTPQEVVDAWMKSDGHCANIMGPYRIVGTGFFNDYWVQDFVAQQ